MDRLLQSALDGFAVLAQHTTDLADGAFRAHVVDDWPSPSFSPIIRVTPTPPTREELEEVRAFWQQTWRTAARPCLLIPTTAGPVPDLDGWQADTRPLHAIVETCAPTAIDLDHASQLTLTPLGNDAAETAFLDLVTTCFPDTRTDPSAVLTQLHAPAATSEIITITRGTPPAPAATSALSIKAGTGFQTWGAVPEPYRGLRLSRILQQAALDRCHELGATTSVTVTRNPRVIGPNRPHVDLWIYRAKEDGHR